MNNALKNYLSYYLKETITKVASVHGGDISTAYKIESPNNTYFLKVNSNSNALTMFQTEAYGLQLISVTNTIKTPKVIVCDSYQNLAFFLLEFIESKQASSKDFKNLGEQLAQLHQCTSDTFGLNQDNFIGRLPQSNNQHKSWIDFYTHERLLPQLELATQKGLLKDTECPKSEHIKNQLNHLFKNVKPALLHGDLWNGNYLISKDGTPYLIDPAVYFGHHEVDIAMSKLFGGFGDTFYSSYFNQVPTDEFTSARIEIYQLYYLLVHLNMFGSSYYGSVISIMKTYF